MPLPDLPPQAMPREKLLAHGAGALSDVELLALLLRTGTQGRNVLMMAHDVLQACGGLSGLLHADADHLRHIKGLGGTAKRAELLAVMELARRAIAAQLHERPLLDNAPLTRQYLQMQLGHLRHECFAVLFLDAQHRLIACEHMAHGGLNHATVHPRHIAVRALHHHAASVVLAHNHPSNQLQPSPQDLALTRHLQQALALLDVAVLDHIIVGTSHSLSMAETGAITPSPLP